MVTRPVGCGQPLPPTRVHSRIRPLQTGPSGQAYLSVKIILLSVGLFIELLQGIGVVERQTAVNVSRGTLEAAGLGLNLASPAV